jgi:hypothetical protein
MKALTICLALLFVSPSLALTTRERKIAEHALAGVNSGIGHNEIESGELQQAKQAVIDAQTSAQSAGEKAVTAEAQAKAEHAELVRSATQNASMRATVKQCNSYWGLGAFAYGFKRLATHFLILGAAIVVLVIVLLVFVPAAGPILGAIWAIVRRMFGAIGAVLGNLIARFRKQPQPILPPTAPISTPWVIPPDRLIQAFRPSATGHAEVVETTPPLQTETATATTVPPKPKPSRKAPTKKRHAKKKPSPKARSSRRRSTANR